MVSTTTLAATGASQVQTLLAQIWTWLLTGPLFMPIVAQGGPGAEIQAALDSIAPELRVIGIGLMTVGLLMFGLSKLAAPIAPEMAASTQGYVTKAFIGMMVIGMASTLASWAGSLFGG